MAFEKVSTILKEVDKKNTAALAFDCYSYESIAWLINAGEELNVPVIVMLYPGMASYIPMEAFAGITKAMAGKVKIPVGLHLDHCMDFNTIVGAMKAGFNSVMIDGSKLEFDENVRVTQEIVKVGHALGVDVEAELGKVGVASNTDDFKVSDIYTTADDAQKFVELTNVDSLAISFGSAHGYYVETPKLDLGRLDEINKTIDTPLVLHGGSGIPDDQLQKAFSLGINKLNVGTEYFALFYSTMRESATLTGDKDNLMGFWGLQQPKVMDYLRKKLSLTILK